MMTTMPLTEEKWRAIVSNDVSYDGRWFYAIKTTGVFCKPSCRSKIPKRHNVLIFPSSQAALAAKFRPCKRCNPTGERRPELEWIDKITQYIEANYHEPLTLQAIADTFHGSAYHFHRTFKRVHGQTPIRYIQHLRVRKAMESLVLTDRTVAAIARDVGVANTSYFITLFKRVTGLTPNEYRRMARDGMRSEVLRHKEAAD